MRRPNMLAGLLGLVSVLALAGCGVEAPPTAPAQPGVSIEGDARIGVVRSF